MNENKFPPLPAKATQAEVTDAACVPEKPLGNNWYAHHVLLDKATLQLVRNAFRNDLERGMSVRGEILDALDKAILALRPAAVPVTNAHPMQPIVVSENGRIRFKKNQIVDDLYELRKVHKLDLNEMACRNYSQEDRNQFAQLIGYSVDGWGTLSYAIDVEKADAIAEAITAQCANTTKKEGA